MIVAVHRESRHSHVGTLKLIVLTGTVAGSKALVAYFFDLCKGIYRMHVYRYFGGKKEGEKNILVM